MNTTYNKKDIVKLVSKRTGVSRKIISRFFDAIIFSIADLLAEMGDNDRIEIRGFGVFEKYYYFPKGKFRNPKTNEPVRPPGKMKLKWYPSSKIKNKLYK